MLINQLKALEGAFTEYCTTFPTIVKHGLHVWVRAAPLLGSAG